MALNPDRVINGSFGELYMGDKWLTNVQSCEATIDIAKKEMKLGGTRMTGYKATSVSGEGTISGFKVTSEFLKIIGSYMRKPRSFLLPVTLRYVLDDPEAFGQEEVELVGCKFWRINFGFKVDELIEESIPFTFLNHNLLSCIDGDLDEWNSEGQSNCD